MKQAKQHGKTELHWIVTLDSEIVSMGSKEMAECVANQLLKMAGQEESAKAEPYLV